MLRRLLHLFKKRKEKDNFLNLYGFQMDYLRELFPEYKYPTNSRNLVIVQKPGVSRDIGYHPYNCPITWTLHFPTWAFELNIEFVIDFTLGFHGSLQRNKLRISCRKSFKTLIIWAGNREESIGRNEDEN